MGNVNFHHIQVFINRLFRVGSLNLLIFKVAGGLKFRFESIDLRLFWDTLKPLQVRVEGATRPL